jgi:ADP-ribosylglycohydrolase
MNTLLKEKIWGSFIGVAIGDAMGMPFHELTPEEINSRCGGLASTFFDIFQDEFIHLGYSAGQVTDDTILTIMTAQAILKFGGWITPEQFIIELAEWVKHNQDIWQHGNVFGPSTKAAFRNYMNGIFDHHLDRTRTWCYSGTSNGSMMRVSPAGWAKPGRWQEAVQLACNVILPTHPTDVSLSAASGQAAAISEALTENATYQSIVDTALLGVKAGQELGMEMSRQTGQRYPLHNLELALELAEKAKDPIEAGHLIRKFIGSHFHVSETLATAFGIFYAAKGEFETAIIAAVNNGGDTDTNASIIGALCGALHGIQTIRNDWIEKVEKVNRIEFELMAEEFCLMLVD